MERSQPDQTAGDPIAAVIGGLVRLLLQHWTLACAEIADSSAGLGMATLFILAALLTGFLAMALLLSGAALALAIVVPVWLAFLLVGGATMLAAGGFLLLARRQSRRCALVPHRALVSLRKNLTELAEQWS